MSDEMVQQSVDEQLPPPPAPNTAPQAAGGAMISQHSAFSKLPIMVKQELAGLPVDKQQAFMEEFERKSKSTAVAYICWLFGLHYAYLGKWGVLVLYWLTAGGLGIWVIVDAFRMPGMLNNYNKDAAVEVMSSLKMVSR